MPDVPVAPPAAEPQTAVPPPQVQPDAVKVVPGKAGAAESGGDDRGDEQIVLAAPDGYYALQVIAANTAAGVAGFFAANSGFAAAPLNVRIHSQGRDWHVGVAGLYPDRAAARAAGQNLPESATPWIRPVKDLKQAILAARQR